MAMALIAETNAVCQDVTIRKGGVIIPYIKTEERERAREQPSGAGELNFAITVLLVKYVHAKGLSYQTINDITGACTGALAEFQRRVAGPYEDSKIESNGDVYPSYMTRKDAADHG